MIVRVNDRGPYASNRIMDVSRRTAEALDFKRYGTAQLKVEYVGPASLKGSEDAKLYATLRNDGPAHLEGEPIMVAEARPAPVRVASLAPYVPAAEEAEARPARRHREMRQERHEERQEERQEEVAAREPSPEPRRYVARPEAVEAAYRRFGTTHEVARAPMPPRYTQRYAEATDTEVRREPRRRDDRQVAYLSPRDGAPHLPIRDPAAAIALRWRSLWRPRCRLRRADARGPLRRAFDGAARAPHSMTAKSRRATGSSRRARPAIATTDQP